MLGAPDQSSAYSLSGHVSISLTSAASLFERRRAVRLLLQSLIITFEGQSELVTPETAYSAARLCSVSQELAPGEPVEFSNEGHEDTDKPCTWNVVFNLPIPGWLPPSDIFGDCREAPPGTRYSLHATAKLAHIEENAAGNSWFSTLCSPFFVKTKTVHARACEITLNRFALPPTSSPSAGPSYPLSNYVVSTTSPDSDKERNSPPIPGSILSKLNVVASIPEHINVDASAFPFTLRLRAPGLSPEDSARLRVTGFTVELEQTDKYRSTGTAYASHYPLPREREQPPHKPLCDPHPVHTLYDIGLLVAPQARHHAVEVSSSLLPESNVAHYPLEGRGGIFNPTLEVRADQWYTMQTEVPFVQQMPAAREALWAGTAKLRPSGQSPFFGVKHAMHVSVTCVYDGEDGEVAATENLRFTLPVDFVRVRPTPVTPPVRIQSLSSHASSESSCSSITMPFLVPYGNPELPAYSQLFYSNGDRKVDDSTPLPLYTPSPNSSCSSLTFEDTDMELRKESNLDLYEMLPLPEVLASGLTHGPVS
ncbi:hypothetical protein BV25DRAFT_428479 [Artomyces pyxidatus]|uniref:Uncharacterized protein n=1 Tax=Artomyces pyxidatus TaxID=48021 RepID=A0ACB8T595_9AGAM|nr:hypothetical protein BV25DRAFT_428479 [Artomyces pyxidatus]